MLPWIYKIYHFRSAGTGNSQNPFNSPNQQSALDPTTNQQVLVSGAHHSYSGHSVE